MNCPHCGKEIPKKANGAEAKYREDVQKAEAAIMALERAMAHPEALDTKTQGYTIIVPHGVFVAACASEHTRLLEAIGNPVKLYAIYRRADKRTPVTYGMGDTNVGD